MFVVHGLIADSRAWQTAAQQQSTTTTPTLPYPANPSSPQATSLHLATSPPPSPSPKYPATSSRACTPSPILTHTPAQTVFPVVPSQIYTANSSVGDMKSLITCGLPRRLWVVMAGLHGQLRFWT